MTQPTPARAPRSYAEAVLLGLLAHNLVAGAICVVLGLPAAAEFLWAIGSGLSLGYALYWLTSEFTANRRTTRFAVVATLFGAMIAAAVLRAFLVGDLLGTLLIVTLLLRRPHRTPHAQPPAEAVPDSGHRATPA